MNTTHLLCIHCRTHMYQTVYHLLVNHWRFCTKIQSQRALINLSVAFDQFILTYLFSRDEHTYLTRPIRLTTQAWRTCSCLCAISLSPINVALKNKCKIYYTISIWALLTFMRVCEKRYFVFEYERFQFYLTCCRSKSCICNPSKISCLAARLLANAGRACTTTGICTTNTRSPIKWWRSCKTVTCWVNVRWAR